MGRKKEKILKNNLNRALLMARTQMSLCTLTFIVWGRRERLGKRDKDCPGVTATLGWSHTCQHMQ